MICCCLVTKSFLPLWLHELQHAKLPCPSLSPGSLLRLMSSESMMSVNNLNLCHPLLLLPSIFPSLRVFSNELALHIRWPKYCSFSITPSNEYSGLSSFRTDEVDLPAIQGTLKSLLLKRETLPPSQSKDNSKMIYCFHLYSEIAGNSIW